MSLLAKPSPAPHRELVDWYFAEYAGAHGQADDPVLALRGLGKGSLGPTKTRTSRCVANGLTGNEPDLLGHEPVRVPARG